MAMPGSQGAINASPEGTARLAFVCKNPRVVDTAAELRSAGQTRRLPLRNAAYA
jgi:hypothetical protein